MNDLTHLSLFTGCLLYTSPMAKNKTEIHVTTVFDGELDATDVDRKSTRLNSSHSRASRMPSSA